MREAGFYEQLHEAYVKRFEEEPDDEMKSLLKNIIRPDSSAENRAQAIIGLAKNAYEMGKEREGKRVHELILGACESARPDT